MAYILRQGLATADIVTYLALSTIIHSTRCDEGLRAAESIAEHEVLESRVRWWAVGRYLRSVPCYRQRWRSKMCDEIPEWLQDG